MELCVFQRGVCDFDDPDRDGARESWVAVVLGGHEGGVGAGVGVYRVAVCEGGVQEVDFVAET